MADRYQPGSHPQDDTQYVLFNIHTLTCDESDDVAREEANEGQPRQFHPADVRPRINTGRPLSSPAITPHSSLLRRFIIDTASTRISR